MRIGQYIYSVLSADAGVIAIVSTRIYPVYLPQDAAYPAIVFMAANVPHQLVKNEDAHHDRATVTFHLWASAAQGENGYDTLDNLDAAVRTALDYVEGTAGSVTVQIAHYDGSVDIRNDEMTLFGREATYTFITKNA